MEKKKFGYIIIIGAFVMICLSGFIQIILGKYIKTENYENRKLAERPNFTIANYAEFPKEYTDYYNDHIPFRNNLITLNSAIDYYLFRKSTNDYVIVGKDNWLFYKRQDDGDPISCYQGTNLLGLEELKSLAENCIKQRDFLEKQGKEFVIFIAPNKERIYWENMPSQYGKPADNYKALQIYKYLKENTDLRIVYPYEELMEYKEKNNYNIWYKTDTHWNRIGAYIGTSTLLAELGINVPAINSEKMKIVAKENVSGDLADMLNLSKQLKINDREYQVLGYNTHQLKVQQYDFFEVFSYVSVEADPRKIYVLRDSFATSMAEYIGSQFSETYMRHKTTYSYEDFIKQNPDVFVYEVVERNVGELGTFSIQ